jgi:hypothetical protein
MRINREILLRVARETAQKRAMSDPELVAAYLTGSLCSEAPFLGNATDVDIVFVHQEPQKVRREILPLTADVHLDIVHNPRSLYEKPKELRIDPWLGPELYDPIPLYVTQHFFEFVQAGVRAEYHDPANVMARASRNAERARQIWSGVSLSEATGPALLLDWLKAVSHAVNAIALLNGGALAERRLLLQFPARAEAAGVPDLAGRLVTLLGGDRVDSASLERLLAEWEKSFMEAAGQNGVHESIGEVRLPYYKQAFQAMLEGESPYDILWPLIRTWTQAALALPPEGQSAWQDACESLGLIGPAFDERQEDLDTFIDAVEDALENLANSQGI